jgi:gliding motility-associated protein GldE
MSLPLTIIRKIFIPVSKALVNSSGFIERRLNRRKNPLSVSDLSHALELTQDDDRSEEEHKILQGIVSFGTKDVKQIMTSRMDITAFPEDTPYQELLSEIIDAGFSRIPIYRNSVDEIIGILYIKDLLAHSNAEDLDWKKLLRSPFVVPENKKIDDLLREFQGRKTHMSIVVDEYGGTLGLVTLEDVIEEIVGDITDEFDDEDLHYSKLDDHNYVFQGKTSLIDLYRILDLDGTPFEAAKGESDTLAGFVIEQFGKIPLKGERTQFQNLTFTVEAADKRKIKQVKVSIDQKALEQEYED